jgi:hypothetical protein
MLHIMDDPSITQSEENHPGHLQYINSLPGNEIGLTPRFTCLISQSQVMINRISSMPLPMTIWQIITPATKITLAAKVRRHP